MNQTLDWLKTELAINRKEYKDAIFLLQWTRNKQLMEEKIDDDLIMQGYEVALKDTLLDFICAEHSEVNFEELWVALETLELVEFFEPLN